MRATYKLGRDVITEFEARNAGNNISRVQISKIFRGGDLSIQLISITIVNTNHRIGNKIKGQLKSEPLKFVPSCM